MEELTSEQEDMICDLPYHEKKCVNNTDTMICGLCAHYDSDMCYCSARGEHEIYEEDTCDGYKECE